MTYEQIARLAQQGGLIYFVLIFAGGLVYAMWPKNKETFQRAARMPLEDDQ